MKTIINKFTKATNVSASKKALINKFMMVENKPIMPPTSAITRLAILPEGSDSK
jgi:hypothetical protein